MKSILRSLAGSLFLIAVFWALSLPAAAADKTYCVQVNYSAVPALVNYRKITLLVNVGTCASVSVLADGNPVTAVSYNSSTGVATLTTTGNSLQVTALNWTAGGTGAATKATLYNNYHWAYSLTFDDNRLSQYDYGKPVLDSFGWRAAEAVVGSWANGGGASGSGSYFMNWACLQALRAAGWDMLNHSYDHPNPLTCNGSATDIVTEVNQNQTLLLSHFPGYNVTQMVFPYESSGANTCAGYPTTFLLSAECGGGSYNFVDTALPFQVQRGGLFGTNDSNWKTLAAAAAGNSRPTWLVEYTHSVSQGSTAAADTYSTNQATLTDLLTYLNNNYGAPGNKSMWFAPAGEVRDYIFTRDDAVVTTCTAVTPTPTATPMTTATRTATLTPTASFTPSRTPTATPSRTSSRTPTPSSTPTAMPTSTATASFSPTKSATATASRTASATSSPTAVFTATPTFSATRTFTLVPSVTSTPTLTAAPSLTATVVPSSTATASTSATATLVWTPTPTASFTPTSSPSATLSATPTRTVTLTPTPSWTATTSSTPSPSPTARVTSSPTVTRTPTLVPTLTATRTPIPPATATPTLTVTPTPSPTPTPTVTAIATSTASPTAVFAGPPVLFPNPSHGEPVSLELTQPRAFDVTVKLFTVAFRKVKDWGPQWLPAGSSVIPLTPVDNGGRPLASGVYYVEVTSSAGRQMTRMLILR